MSQAFGKLGTLDTQRMALHRRRKATNALALALALAAMAFGVFWLIWILVETVRLGLGGLAWSVFTESTPPASTRQPGCTARSLGSICRD